MKPYLSPWKLIYENYRRIETNVLDMNCKWHTLLIDKLINLRYHKTLQEINVLRRNSKKNIPAFNQQLLKEFDGIDKTLHKVHAFANTSEPFEDVYHFALYGLNQTAFGSSRLYTNDESSYTQMNYLYRGQRDENWLVESSIFRGNEQKIKEQADRLQKVRQQICNTLNYDYEDTLAICQHYAEVLNVSTWLCDFSRNPWVALFFASHHGKAKTNGVVWHLSINVWKELCRLSDMLGKLNLKKIDYVPRIKNQTGVFLEASIGGLFEQVVAPGRYTIFKQREGLVFEDMTLNITEDTIYPPNDIIKEKLLRLDCREAALPKKSPRVKVDLFVKADNAKMYESMIRGEIERVAIYNSFDINLSAMKKEIELLAAFHAMLQTQNYREKLRAPSRSYSKLKIVAGRILNSHLEKHTFSVKDDAVTIYANGIHEDLNVLNSAMPSENSNK